MKRTHRPLVLIALVVLMCILWMQMSIAEPSDALSTLTQGVGMPDTYTYNVTPLPGEKDKGALRELTVHSNVEQTPVRVRLQLSLLGTTKVSAEWATREQTYTNEIETLLKKQSSANARSLAGEIKFALDQLHLEQSQTNGGIVVRIHTIEVTAPFYETLKRGARGDDVTKLQQRLIDLGFLEGEADGQFGPATQKGVEALQTHVRALEQEIIDEVLAAEKAPAPTPAATPVAATGQDGVEATPAPTLEPTAVPAPTPIPEPVTQVDGIANADLLAYLYADQFSVAGPAMQLDQKGDAVLRLQKRLFTLDCLWGEPDAHYGDVTERAVRIFQHYNDLPETGIADRPTQELLYSKDAKLPAYPVLAEGSKSDAVRTLQSRLKQLGFMTGSADSGFGGTTKTGVKNLQAYMNKLQTAEGQKWNFAEDGIADPLLQEAFYAASFPGMPKEMRSGANGLDVQRLQRRLSDLEYLFTSPDGRYGNGTTKAITEFQRRNELPETGEADAQTLKVLFSQKPKRSYKPYVIKVSIKDQRVYAYALDGNDEYTRLVRTMKCSTGLPSTPTIKGTFQSTTGPAARWHYFKKYFVWAQYAYSIKGDYLFHSVLFNHKGGSPTRASVNNLGRQASHGCVRLAVDDAQWIWSNCPKGTKVIVY